MKAGWRVFSALFFVLIVAEVMILAPGDAGKHRGAPGSLDAAPAQIPTEEQVLRGVHLVETRDGRKEWELDAADATGMKDKGDWVLRKVRAKFFDKKGAQAFTAEGQRGSIAAKSKDMKISGQVVVQSAMGYRMDTDNVVYHSDKELLESADPVNLYDTTEPKNTRMEAKGMGFTGYVQDNFIDLLSDVTVRRGLKDGRIVNVRSQKARFNGLDRSANFSGEVNVDVGTWRVTGPEARFLYDDIKKAITSLEVEGGVRLSDLDKWATARRFTMSFLSDQYTLNGQPRLVQDSDELRGEEIVLFDGGKRIQVRRAKATVDSSKEKGGGL